MIKLGATPLSPAASFHGVYACGPRPGPAWTEPGVPAQLGLYGSWEGFQCSELSSRFFFTAYGLYAAGDGVAIADDARQRHPADVQLVENNKGALPQVGDIVSLNAGSFGHTYVIIGATNVDTTLGDEDVTVLEQNYSKSGVRPVRVRGWNVQDPGFIVLRWAHAYKDPWAGVGGAPPPGPALTVSAVTATSVTLDWSAWATPAGVHEYDVYQNSRHVGHTVMAATRYVDTGLTPGSSYAYSIVAHGGTLAQPISTSPVTVTTGQPNPAPRPRDGSFVQTPDGSVYRIAGGSPLKMYDWTPFGGPLPASAISWADFVSLPGVPRDGTFLQIARTGVTYIIAGGAPMFIQDWAPYGGAQPVITVNAGDIAALPTAPADGTYIHGAGTTLNYVVAGGAPLPLDDWAPYGGPQPAVSVSPDTIAGMPRTPSNGTFITAVGASAAYVIAGGAPLAVGDWAPYGGPQATVPVSPHAIARLHPVPWDGTLIQAAGTSSAYIVAGGAPLLVTDWAPFGGPQPTVMVAPTTLTTMPTVPADGTLILSAGLSSVYVVAAGALTLFNDGRPYHGDQPIVPVSLETMMRMRWGWTSAPPLRFAAHGSRRF